jgi:hypothetical protein
MSPTENVSEVYEFYVCNCVVENWGGLCGQKNNIYLEIMYNKGNDKVETRKKRHRTLKD